MPTLPCPPEHWPAFSRRLDALLALSEPQRSAALAALSPAEAVLRPWLAALLDKLPAAESSHFLQAPQLAAPSAGPAHQPGQRIGPYALLRELGRGGMGVVWLARRDDGAYLREVALKLPHAHLLSGAVAERFARERDILASLSHPHIARFYDAGLAGDGQPYLALEAVDGQPITTWCRGRRLGLTQRLALFAQVTAAVAHAHGRLVAHRDLKPANVLVADDGQVKLLDFGIAKLLQTEAGDDPANIDSTGLTQAGGILATPQYAAPEQLSGGPVSVATDVYALGLMLFELLTDQQAFAGRRREALLDEPPLPSQHAPDGLRRRALIGDLDAIVARALQAAPEARYASVAALADDLARHKRHEPIQARRINAWHRAGKLLRRHRLAAGLSSALVLALGAGLAGVAWQAQEARAQARRAEAVKDFLLGIFQGADPRLPADKPSGQTPAKALLDRAVARIDGRFADDPGLQIELLRTAAEIYRELNETRAYETLQTRQLALLQARFGPLHQAVLAGRLEAAEQTEAQGGGAACRALLPGIEADLQRAGLAGSLLHARWWQAHSLCRRDQADQAAQRLASMQQAEALFARLAPGQRPHVTVLGELAVEHLSQRQLEASITVGLRAVRMSQGLAQRNEAELQTLHSNLGLAYGSDGRLREASDAFGHAAAVAERTSGINAPVAWPIRSKQARLLHLVGDRAGANKLFEALLAQLPAAAESGPNANVAREDIGTCLLAEGQAQAGLVLLQQAERGHLRGAGYEFDLRRVRRQIGDALDRLGRFDEARQALAWALADAQAHDKPASQELANARERWARFQLDRGDLPGAQASFAQVIAQAGRKTWVQVVLAQAGQARVALAQGDEASALALSESALLGWGQRSGRFDIRMQAYLWRVRAAVLDRLGRPDEARALRDQALAAARRTDSPTSPTLTQPGYLGL